MLAPPSLSGAHMLAPPSPHRARRDARAALATGRAVSLLELTAGPTEFSGSSPIALPHTPQSALAPTSSSYSSSVSLPSEPASDASWRMRARRRGRRVRRHAPCGEGGASVCAPDGEGGAGGAPCGDWRGQRTARASAHPLWRGRRERGRARWRLARAARAWWATVQKPRVATTFRLRAISTTFTLFRCGRVYIYATERANAGRCRTRVCDNGSNVAQEIDLALLVP